MSSSWHSSLVSLFHANAGRLLPIVLMVINEPCFVSSVLHAVQSQQTYLQGSPDVFVDPFGVVILECQVNPAELNEGFMVQWRYHSTVTSQDSTVVSYLFGSKDGFNTQDGIMKLIQEPGTGKFNLKISNTTYEAHDGEYVCEVSLPQRNESPGRTLRTKSSHLYVKCKTVFLCSEWSCRK